MGVILNCIYFKMIYFATLWNFSEWEKQKYLPEVTRSFLKFFYQIPCLIFMISLLLFLFFSASESTYSLWSNVATVYIFQALTHYCMKSTFFTWLLNILNSYQQHTAAIYISVSVSCDTKEHQYTFRTANYSRSHSHTAIRYIVISNTQQPYTY